VPARAWRRLSAGAGAKGPRFYDWAYLPYRSVAAPGWQKGLLVRRKVAAPDKLTFYLTLSPAATSLAELVRVAGTRWTIEAAFEAAKGEVGLDQYEVRSWTGWHRHVTLAMLAHAYLAVVRQAATGGTGGARPRGRASAPHRAGGAPPRLAAGVGASARPRAGRGVVDLAPAAPAARPPLPLATTNQSD
jgi:SRSO17 transposase